ncbi:polymorphic toxin-type HINT domain-containing protein [Streptomyces camelliae]|uniref:Polymorphic toxin-type HINT domain-containing protein n=1 Tax=Streptomyces camelliae TaxID=3004093 RepID=A0ABY7P4N5_9ACTN|nr:polymorphic toxin-type HINT domain-containing protein [Streptomyces sp. HUAS 2-6]WBO63791.1 polymorphic toxin-type HINT domain-containing protein [Streptomyces sp. HUAS 2-6]
MLGGLVYAIPAAADEPGDNPANPYQRTLRISLGAQARADRCQAGQAVHYGGPDLKAAAAAKLTSTDAGLRAFVTPDAVGGEWGQAATRDRDAGIAALNAFRDRQTKLDESNKPYRSVNSSGGRDFWAPEFGADIVTFTLGTQQKLYDKAAEDPTPRPGQASLDQAKKVLDAFDTGGDAWAAAYKDVAGKELLDTSNLGHSSANDVATFLRFGGFATKAPEPDSLEFRTEVEALKQAWAACDSDNPIDHYRMLTGVVTEAYAEWESEYAGQAEQRKQIVAAEAAAAKETRAATEAMIEAVRQAWLADQILYWQKYWAAHKGAINYPKAAEFTKATADLNAAKAAAAKQVTVADAAVGRAKTAADTVTAQQQKAWQIADAAKLPRGRGLLYAQQSVQVTKASYAAAQAAAKATLTASNAAKATAADSQTLLALAKTQTHALNTEFRKTAALEAKAQAKAAADSAAKLAAEAAADATTAKNARTTAEKAEQTAREQAAEAKRQRGIAESERADAERERDLAASERAKAGAAEERARGEQDTARKARTAAESAGSTAADKLAAAEDAELRAYQARNEAVKAEHEKNATASRAAALESAAAAADGTSAAATRARAAADDATTAAVNARAAATRAEGAAKRSRSAADAAQSAYAKTHAAAATAHAAAAEAIDAAAAAKEKAKKADGEANKARTAAATARTEATAAVAEAAKTAAWAAKTAGYATATAQYAQAARDAATAATKAADEAISLGSPYRETDTSAAYAVLIGQTSKTLAEQQASAAKAKSDEAKKAAAQAKALADKAAGDAKTALQAAADAADYAVQAVNSAAAANASAAAAAADAAAAKKADGNAQKYDEQAGTDAFYAHFAANEAESAAAQADNDATEAEKDAAGARSAADSADQDAAAAGRTATKAEGDATAAEGAAARADTYAGQADKAATRAEAEERERARQERAQVVDSGGSTAEYVLTKDEEAALLAECGQTCVDQYREAMAGANHDVLDWVRANGGAILLELLGVPDAKKCFSDPDVESCLWTLVNALSAATLIGKAPAVATAVVRISAGIGKFFEGAAKARKTLKALKVIIDARLAKGVSFCVKHSFVAGTMVKLADGGVRAIEKVTAGDHVLTAWPGDTATERHDVVLTHRTTTDTRFTDLTVATPSGRRTVTGTSDHPFYDLTTGSWTDAGRLSAGHRLQTADRGTVTVVGVTSYTKPQVTYDLTVEGVHSYFVMAGDSPVLVHNINCRTITSGALKHIGDEHLWGGSYHEAGDMGNVFAEGIDAGKLKKLIEEAAQFGREVPRAKADPRGGNYIDYAFDGVTTGANGQNGIRLVVDDYGNLVTAMPKNIW